MANETHQYKLNFDTNANQAAGDVNKLGQSIDKTKKATDDLSKSNRALDKTFDEVYGDLKPLTARMGEAEDRLYELALAGQQATKEFQDLLQVTANYRATQIEVDKVVDASASTIRDKLGGAVQLASGLFQGFTSGMALFGDTSIETQQQLLKLEAAFQFAQAISSVIEMKDQWLKLTKAVSFSQNEIKHTTSATDALKNATQNATQAAETNAVATISEGTAATFATGAFSALKVALASLGIGLVIAGLSALISNFDKIKKFSFSNLFKTSETEVDIKNTEAAAKSLEKTIEEEKTQLELFGNTMSDLQRKELESRIDYHEKLLAENKRYTDVLKKRGDDNIEDFTSLRDELVKIFNEVDFNNLTTLEANRIAGVLGPLTPVTRDNVRNKIELLNKSIKTIEDEEKKHADNLADIDKSNTQNRNIIARNWYKERQKLEDDFVKQFKDKQNGFHDEIENADVISNTARIRLQQKRDIEALDEIVTQAKKEKIFTDKVNDAYLQAKAEVFRKTQFLYKKNNEEIKSLEDEGQDERIIENKKFIASLIKDDLKRLELQKEILDEEYNLNKKNLEDKRKLYDSDSIEYASYTQKLLNLQNNYYKNVTTNSKQTIDTENANQATYRNYFIGQQDQFFQDRRAALDEQETVIRATTYKSQQDQIIALNENYKAKKQLDADYAAYQGEIASIYADALGSIGDLLTESAGTSKKQQKQGLIISNAAGAAQVVINTLVGNAKLTADLGPLAPPLIAANFVAMGASLAAMAVATNEGLKKIGAGGSADTGIGASAKAAPTQQPNVSFVASSGNQLAQTIANTKQGPDTIKAFVVSADITTAQSLDANKISATSI